MGKLQDATEIKRYRKIILVQLEPKVYEVKKLVNCIEFDRGQILTQEDVQKLLDGKTMTVIVE